MSRRLSAKQKLANKRIYRQIRKGYNSVKQRNEDITYKQFKNRVNAQKEANPNLSYKQAIKKVQRSEAYLSPAERSRENFISGLKENYKEVYNYIRELNRDEKGRYQKLNLIWRQYRGKYGYSFRAGGKIYFIDVTNSPEEVMIYEIQE